MCLSCTVTDIFNIDYCCDLEISVRGRSRSVKMVLIDKYRYTIDHLRLTIGMP